MDEEMKKEEVRKTYREFTVTPGMSGFKVKIGCSEVYFTTAEKCALAVHGYLLNPQETEKLYQSTDQRGNKLACPTENDVVSDRARANLQTEATGRPR